ncbi:MAG: DinB family protein [Thermoplasmata archaeon]|nr:DinB family protein [Candidatus Sysuiplasma acidicola]MBX8645512.1 DinB family protein [Candidatus Sysuiplasma acidicola]MDH2904913.1 DinB family protein [Methanomassiliicoccales archaeon]
MTGHSRDSVSVHLTPLQARSLFAYNRRLFERYTRRIRRLPWNDVSRHRGTGHQSLFATLVHILNAHEVWIGYILQGRNSDQELEQLFRDTVRKPVDWRGFNTYNSRVWTIVDAYIGGLKPHDMARPVHAFWMAGKYTVSDGLMQTTFEEAHHIGEIIGVLWQQDIEPPHMTWIELGQAISGK